MTTQTPDAVREAVQYAIEAIGKEADYAMHVTRATRDVVEAIEAKEARFKQVLAALDSRAGDAGEGLLAKIEAEARRYASHYPLSSDGQNTFVMFAEYVAGLAATPAPAVDAVPAGEVRACSFADCPPGLFRWNGLLCFKSEYSTKAGQPDAYCVDSGEYFWGGTSGDLEKRRNLIVQPVAAASLLHGEGRK